MKFNGLELMNYDEAELVKIYGTNLDKSAYDAGQAQPGFQPLQIFFINEMKQVIKPLKFVIYSSSDVPELVSDMFPELTFVGSGKARKNVTARTDALPPDSVMVCSWRERVHKDEFTNDVCSISEMYQHLAEFHLSPCSACLVDVDIPYNFKLPFLNGSILIDPFSNKLSLVSHRHSSLEDMGVYNGTQIRDRFQLVNNYWRKLELELDEEQEAWLEKNGLKHSWDNVALWHILKQCKDCQGFQNVVDALRELSN